MLFLAGSFQRLHRKPTFAKKGREQAYSEQAYLNLPECHLGGNWGAMQ